MHSKADFPMNPPDLGTTAALPYSHPVNFTSELSIQISNSSILEAFSQACNASAFQVIEQTVKSATAVRRESFSLYQILLCFLPHNQQQVISAVKLSITLDPFSCKRQVNLKGLHGSTPSIKPLADLFLTELQCIFPVDSEVTEEENTQTCKHQTSSYYQIYRVLSSDEYSLGKGISQFTTSFREDPGKGMGAVKDKIEEVVKVLANDYNCGTSGLLQAHSRPAVEKFIFGKIYKQLFGAYKAKANAQDGTLCSIKGRASEDNIKLMKILGIREKYMLGGVGAYKESISVLNTLENSRCPLDKLNCLLTVIGTMRSIVVEYWRGKEELMSMDDELPVLMFIVMRSSVKRPLAQVWFLRDYVGDSYENEKRILVNMESAVLTALEELTMDNE